MNVNGVFQRSRYSAGKSGEKLIFISPTTICLPQRQKKRLQQGALFTVQWKCNKKAVDSHHRPPLTEQQE